jgi:cell shape-determining protein MreC
VSNSQWHEDQSIGERAFREIEREQKSLRHEVEKLRKENARLRSALNGLFKPDGVPYANWSAEMHAAHIALETKE